MEDIKDLSFLGKKTFDQSFGHLFKDRRDLINYLEKTFSAEKLNRSILKPYNVFWIAFMGKTPIGYAKIQLNTPSEFIVSTSVCKLQKIYVLNEYVSKGIGAKLQQLIFDKAIENNCKDIWLSVLKSNKKAVSFYKRNEYEIVGEHPFSIGKEDFDFWVMRRKL
ncbi:GNAT family N-acetyltransferase [Aquimarina sp. SS2-1]|uniref:GNAT family N-acetyltransferase n=1 Tax=Aquimarina besae TaxID=3342247 RepID=UPI00366A5C37